MYQNTINHSFLFISIIGMFKRGGICKAPDVNESYVLYEEGLNAMKGEYFFAAKKIFRSRENFATN